MQQGNPGDAQNRSNPRAFLALSFLDVPHLDVSSDSVFFVACFCSIENMALFSRSLYTWSILKGTCKWSSYLITCSVSHPAVTFDGFFLEMAHVFVGFFGGWWNSKPTQITWYHYNPYHIFYNGYIPGMREWSQQVFQSGISSHQL